MGVTNAEWIKKGTQKEALARALQYPMTASQLLHEMRRGNCVHVELRDIWRLLRKFQHRGLIICLARAYARGSLYYFTNGGRVAVRKGLNLWMPPLPLDVDWKKYALVTLGDARKAILCHICKPPLPQKVEPKTIAEIKKQLYSNHPLPLGTVIRAVHELERMKLIRRSGTSRKRNRPTYLTTRLGHRIVCQLSQGAKAPPNVAPATLNK